MATFSAWLAEAGFGRPRGLLGQLGGRLMARGNAATEQHVVRLAELQEHEVVLVVGPGPGVGLRDAAQYSAHVVGIDPSPVMLDASRRRCTVLIEQGRVRLVQASTEQTRQPDCSVDVVISVNNVQLWPDQQAGCTELARVMRPGGRLLLSAHHKWLSGGPEELADTVAASGFTDISTWTWQPPGHMATTAAQLQARRT